MNRQRRKMIERAKVQLTVGRDLLQQARDEEDEALANMSDNLREGERGEAMQQHVDDLDEIINNLDEAISQEF